jgi:hypothetical protein
MIARELDDDLVRALDRSRRAIAVAVEIVERAQARSAKIASQRRRRGRRGAGGAGPPVFGGGRVTPPAECR